MAKILGLSLSVQMVSFANKTDKMIFNVLFLFVLSIAGNEQTWGSTGSHIHGQGFLATILIVFFF